MKPRLFGILLGPILLACHVPASRGSAESDRTYNGLIHWDNWNSPFWQEYLEKSEWALAIREAGKRIR